MSKDSMSFCDGKYTVTSDSGALYAHRHGEPWNRDLTGDNLVYWMLVDALALKQDRDELAESERSCREDNQKFLTEIDALGAERDALAAELKALREQEPIGYISPKASHWLCVQQASPSSYGVIRIHCSETDSQTVPLYAPPRPRPRAV